MDHFPRSHAYRFERIRLTAPQREGSERDEPLLDHACGGWYLKYSSEPHRVSVSCWEVSGQVGRRDVVAQETMCFHFSARRGCLKRKGQGVCSAGRGECVPLGRA